MFKKIISYENFDGEQRSKEFYFHLGKAELLTMVAEGSFEERLAKMIETKDMVAILGEMRKIVDMSIGVRSEDGETFVKNDEIRQKLMASPAYDELLMELVTDPEKSSEFIKNLLPSKMQQQLEEKLKEQANGDGPDPFKEPEDNRPAWMKEGRIPTSKEIRNASPEEIEEAFKRRQAGKISE